MIIGEPHTKVALPRWKNKKDIYIGSMTDEKQDHFVGTVYLNRLGFKYNFQRHLGGSEVLYVVRLEVPISHCTWAIERADKKWKGPSRSNEHRHMPQLTEVWKMGYPQTWRHGASIVHGEGRRKWNIEKNSELFLDFRRIMDDLRIFDFLGERYPQRWIGMFMAQDAGIGWWNISCRALTLF